MAEDCCSPKGDEMSRAFIALGVFLLTMPACTVVTPSIVEQRLQRTEDELAIRRVLYDYHWAIDNRDFDLYASLFAKDGEFVTGSMVYKGPERIRAMLVGIFGKTPPDYVNLDSIEITVNPEIEIDGDHATVKSGAYLLEHGLDGNPMSVLVGGYDDQFVREDGKWKIMHRIDHIYIPAPGEGVKLMPKRSKENQ